MEPSGFAPISMREESTNTFPLEQQSAMITSERYWHHFTVDKNLLNIKLKAYLADDVLVCETDNQSKFRGVVLVLLLNH